MKLNKEASEAKRKVLDMYPNACVRQYYCPALGGRYGIFVPLSETQRKPMWLETNNASSPTREKAWIDAHRYILTSFLTMLHY